MKSETVELLDRTRGIRLSSEEDILLDRLAREAGMTVSQLVRKTLRDALFLPMDGTNRDIEAPSLTGNGAAIGETPTSEAVAS
jgi:hypothetical protein